MRKLLLLSLVGALMITVSPCGADIPHLINYQGMLTQTDDTPLDGTYDLTFKIYGSESGVDSLWWEHHSGVTVTDGLFNVILGSINPIPSSIFDDTIRYFAITLGTDPELSPRIRFTSFGYAYRAEWADTSDYSFQAQKSDTADYAISVPGGPAGEGWSFRVTDTADTTLITGGKWGLARQGNVLYGNADSTHVNLGVGCTTGTSGQNYKYSTVGGGWFNTASGREATVGGGYHNTALPHSTTVAGGANNTAGSSNAVVGGGFANCALEYSSTVSGGYQDTASGEYATLGGGFRNKASGNRSTISGGESNIASGTRSTIGGGGSNIVSGLSATVAGGYHDTASGECAVVGGGHYNTASAKYSIIGGGYDNTASGKLSVVGGGDQNNASDSCATIGGGEENMASAHHSTVGGGLRNASSGGSATIGGGVGNSANSDYSVIGGGYYNGTNEIRSTVGGGWRNYASGWGATIAGGESDTAQGIGATIAGGYHNIAGANATVGGGRENTASGEFATIPGGKLNTASGKCSFAAGIRAKANHNGAFVWADSTNADFTSTGKNQFLIRASGGVGIGTNQPDVQLDVSDLIRIQGLNYSVSSYPTTGEGLELGYRPYDSTGIIQCCNRDHLTPGDLYFPLGNIGIGVSEPTEKLDINGTARLRGISSSSATPVHVDSDGKLWKQTSSLRYKKNIRELNIDPQKFLQLEPVRFEWKTTGVEDIGLIAEDVENVIPNLVIYDSEGRPDGVKYDKIAIYLLDVVKMLKAKNDELEKRIEVLESRE